LPPQSKILGEASEGASTAPSENERGAKPLRGLLCHIVRDLDLAGHDVGARLLQALLHVGGDETAVVLVDRVADAALGDAERADAAFQGAVLRGLEGLV